MPWDQHQCWMYCKGNFSVKFPERSLYALER